MENIMGDVVKIDKKTTKNIQRLIYMRKQIDETIDGEINDYILRGRPSTVEELRDRIIYKLDDNLDALKMDR